MALIDNLISYYKLDENAANTDVEDSHGTNEGTANTNTSNLSVAGKINTAFYFNGSEFVDVGNDSSLGFDYDEPFSVSFWIKFTDAGQYFVVGKILNVNHAVKGWSIFTYLGKIYFQLNSGVGYGDNELQVNANQVDFSDGTWKHVVVTYDGSSDESGVTFYVNNTFYANFVDQNTLSATIINTRPSTIAANSTPGIYLDGTLDEIGIWAKELSSAEVTQLWNGGAGLAYDDFPVIGTNMQVNISDVLKDISEIKINIGGVLKDVTEAKINIGDVLKDIF